MPDEHWSHGIQPAQPEPAATQPRDRVEGPLRDPGPGLGAAGHRPGAARGLQEEHFRRTVQEGAQAVRQAQGVCGHAAVPKGKQVRDVRHFK